MLNAQGEKIMYFVGLADDKTGLKDILPGGPYDTYQAAEIHGKNCNVSMLKEGEYYTVVSFSQRELYAAINGSERLWK